ncbi:MAG TPA: aminotransferase V, partial [Kandleria vitulina]|nr:aminotransferase V [Kandleria vitulina]
MVYLDYCANAPVEQQVLDRFYEVTKNIYANPNSIHKLGREAEDLLNKSADHIASYFNVTRDELIFTSGATESNNLAIKGICERYRNKGKHIIIGSMEHNSLVSSAMRMQEMGFEVELAPVDQDGRIDRDELEWMIRDDTILVAIAAVDS